MIFKISITNPNGRKPIMFDFSTKLARNKFIAALKQRYPDVQYACKDALGNIDEKGQKQKITAQTTVHSEVQ